MKTLVKITYVLFTMVFFTYLLFPSFGFPEKPPDALQSKEPADTETLLRRAYFTNFDRGSVMNYYKDQFSSIGSFGVNISLPTYRLNYPPEEAKVIIRDQTRSTFLEEVVHPFRESIFINGFEPKDAKDTIFIDNRNWKQKIIIRQMNSSIFTRFFIGLAVVILIPLIFNFWKMSLFDFSKRIQKCLI